jgi:formylglycine-generating enzyme required for sulfatase activity
VLRGGSWFYGPSYCRSSRRGNYEATGSTAFIGFRVARAP